MDFLCFVLHWFGFAWPCFLSIHHSHNWHIQGDEYIKALKHYNPLHQLPLTAIWTNFDSSQFSPVLVISNNFVSKLWQWIYLVYLNIINVSIKYKNCKYMFAAHNGASFSVRWYAALHSLLWMCQLLEECINWPWIYLCVLFIRNC